MRKRNPWIIAFLFCVVFLVTAILISPKQYNAYTKTAVDLTGLVAGNDTNHTHIYEAQFNDSAHWKECWICGNIISRQSHNLVTLGTYHCDTSVYGHRRQYCTDPNCGYDVQLPDKPHTVSSDLHTNQSQSVHFKYCTVCGATIKDSGVACTDSAGRRLGCGNNGTCVGCGKVYSNTGHGALFEGVCAICGTQLVETSSTVSPVGLNSQKVNITIKPLAGTSITLLDNNVASDALQSSQFSSSGYSASSSGGVYYVSFTITYNNTVPANNGKTINARYTCYYSYGGKTNGLHVRFAGKPDNYAPSLTNIRVDGNGSDMNNFSKSATVIATFNDAWTSSSNYVQARLLDSDKTTVLSDWKTATSSGTYHTVDFDIVAEIREPANVYVQAMDACGNTTILESGVTMVQYIDALAPRMTSNDTFIGDWAKTRDITFTAVDRGVGNVSIAFNDASDYQFADKNGDNYSRTYTFYGDVYDSVIGALYLKDSLGNERTERVKIGKLDGTAPTITKAEKSTLKTNRTIDISVAAHDRHITFGEGSGVVGYTIVYDNETIPEETAFLKQPVFNVDKNGTYYVYAIDLVGNISSPMVVEVTEITIDITGTVEWVDNSDSLGYRPDDLVVNLYCNGELAEFADGLVVNNVEHFSFLELPTTDMEGNKLSYEVVQEPYEMYYLEKEDDRYVQKDAYTVTSAMTEDVYGNRTYKFVNTFNIPNEPVINVRDKFTNTLMVKSNVDTTIILKQLETLYSSGYVVGYTDGYTGFSYNIEVGPKVMNNTVYGKYEIVSLNVDHRLKSVSLDSGEMEFLEEGGRYYLIIPEVKKNTLGTLTLTYYAGVNDDDPELPEDPDGPPTIDGGKTSESYSNLWMVSVSESGTNE